MPLFPTIRYVSPSLAECVLNSSIPIPNDGDPVYKVEACFIYLTSYNYKILIFCQNYYCKFEILIFLSGFRG